jgi:hypothetical protein
MHRTNSMLHDLALRADSSAGNVMRWVYKRRNFRDYSQPADSGPYPVPHESGPHSQTLFLKDEICIILINTAGQDCAVAQRLATGQTVQSLNAAVGLGLLFSPKPVQGDPGGHPAFFNGYRGSSRRIKRPWLSFHHPPLLTSRLKQSRAIFQHPSVRHDTLRREHYQLHLRLPSCYFTSGFPTILLYEFLIYSVCPLHRTPPY